MSKTPNFEIPTTYGVLAAPFPRRGQQRHPHLPPQTKIKKMSRKLNSNFSSELCSLSIWPRRYVMHEETGEMACAQGRTVRIEPRSSIRVGKGKTCLVTVHLTPGALLLISSGPMLTRMKMINARWLLDCVRVHLRTDATLLTIIQMGFRRRKSNLTQLFLD